MANDGQRQQMLANTGQRQPTQADECQRKPAKQLQGGRGGARDVSRLEPQVCFLQVFFLILLTKTIYLPTGVPTQAHDSQRRPTMANDSKCRPMLANDSQRRPTNASESRQISSKGAGGARDAKRLEPQVYFVFIHLSTLLMFL